MELLLLIVFNRRRQPNFEAWYTRNGITELSQVAPRTFGWAAITLGIGPHFSYRIFNSRCYI